MTDAQGPTEFEAGGAEGVARQEWLGARPADAAAPDGPAWPAAEQNTGHREEQAAPFPDDAAADAQAETVDPWGDEGQATAAGAQPTSAADAGDADDTADSAEDGVDTAASGHSADESASEPQEAVLTMPTPAESGDARVDAVVAPLQHLGDQSTEEHVSAYEAAHSGLQDLLADLDRDTDDGV